MAVLPYSYSFLDTNVTIVGLGGVFAISQGGNAEEGFTVSMLQDKNIQEVGADGSIQNTLVASDAGEIQIMLLKASPVNAQLDIMYNLQKATSLGWGANVLSINNTTSGDSFTMVGGAFKRRPVIKYAMKGGIMEWTFQGKIQGSLGGGIVGALSSFGASFV